MGKRCGEKGLQIPVLGVAERLSTLRKSTCLTSEGGEENGKNSKNTLTRKLRGSSNVREIEKVNFKWKRVIEPTIRRVLLTDAAAAPQTSP